MILIEENNTLMMYSQIWYDGFEPKQFHKVCRLGKIQARIDVCPWKFNLDQIDRNPYFYARILEEKIKEIPGIYIPDKFRF